MNTFFTGGFAFYYHNFGITKKHFLANPLLKKSFAIVGTTRKDDIPEEFVASIEHLKYPFLGNQWHPEKYANEKGAKYKFLDKSKKSILLMNSFLKGIVDTCRDKAKPLKDLPSFLNSYLAWNTDPVQTYFTGNDRVYVAPRIAYDDEFEDEL